MPGTPGATEPGAQMAGAASSQSEFVQVQLLLGVRVEPLRHRIVVVGVVVDAVAAVAAVAAVVVVVALAAARGVAVPLGHETEQQRRVEGEAVDRRLGLGPRLVAAQRRRVLGVCLGSQ